MSQREFRIVVVGSAGAGKSTLVRSMATVHDPATAAATQQESGHDCTDLVLPNGDQLRLYCPAAIGDLKGMLPALLRDTCGVVVLVDAADAGAAEAFEFYLHALVRHAPGIPAVIGLSKVDLLPEFDVRPWQLRLHAHGLKLPLVPLDTREVAGILLLMDVLMSEIESISLLSRYA